jgi:hypothetical protein
MPLARDARVPQARAAMLWPWDATCCAWAHTYSWRSRLDLPALTRRTATLPRPILPPHGCTRRTRPRTRTLPSSCPCATRACAPLSPRKAVPLPLSEPGCAAPPCLPRHGSTVHDHHPSMATMLRSCRGQASAAFRRTSPRRTPHTPSRNEAAPDQAATPDPKRDRHEGPARQWSKGRCPLGPLYQRERGRKWTVGRPTELSQPTTPGLPVRLSWLAKPQTELTRLSQARPSWPLSRPNRVRPKNWSRAPFPFVLPTEGPTR